MDILNIRKLAKRYGALVIADGIDIDVSAGEIVGILGPNGAGKTTLFNLIAGTARADGGQICYRDKDITATAVAGRCRMGIARSFQIPHPFVGMTVFENILVGSAFGGSARKKDAEDAALAAMSAIGLDGKANRMAGQLGLLDRKRLELGRALATGPDLLLLDEIAGGLTLDECADLIEVIRAIHRQGTTIIWIEHVVQALLAVATRLIVLHGGRKLADGEPHAVYGSRVVKELYLGIDADE